MRSGSERREFPRIPTDQIICFSEGSGAEQSGRGVNLSAGGICFTAVACEIELGEFLTLTFRVHGEEVTAGGRVVWATETDPLSLEVGVEFEELDARGRRLIESLGSGGDSEG